jgi:hypothetical protein
VAEAQAVRARKPTPSRPLASRLGAEAIVPATPAQLAAAMDIPAGTLLSASILTSDPAAFGVGSLIAPPLLTKFPRRGQSFLVMASGFAATAEQPNSSESTSDSLTGLNTNTGTDMAQLELLLAPPPGAQCLEFEYVFASEEFQEFVGTAFNDSFVAQLNTNAINISGTTITAPTNFAVDPLGNLISINSNFGVVPLTASTYDAATTLLVARANVAGQPTVTLYLSIFDVGDSIYDSAVAIDNFRWVTDAAACAAGSGLGNIIVSPQPGYLVDGQPGDLALIITGQATGGSVQVNNVDLSQSLLACEFGVRQDGLGHTVRCPGFLSTIMASGAPPWTVLVTIDFADGNQQTELAVYDRLTFEGNQALLDAVLLPSSTLIASTQSLPLIVALSPNFFFKDVVGGGVFLNGVNITAPILGCLNSNPSIPVGTFGGVAFVCPITGAVLPPGLQALNLNIQFSDGTDVNTGSVLRRIDTVE